MVESDFFFFSFHRVDIDRVVNGAPWTFTNHLLVFHLLQANEDPMLVPLIYSYFWVQVHYLLLGLFSKTVTRQLGNFFGLFEEYDAKQFSGGYLPYLHMRVRLDIQYPFKRHGDCFFPIRLTGEVNEFDMGWDMSLRAVGRRVTIVDSVWLQKENVGGFVGGVSSDRAISGDSDERALSCQRTLWVASKGQVG
ncbi:hypothetical protein Gorai_013294 [Gossypium raimondii]|uniref:DUF4283 domain-containing protein n=1 Tax=Gossypium raimondii TaxID=29730 RepID=A0A7J8Q5A7_GOSRA|nr:hypothetical protein [Gossypium raimondii]